MNYSKQQQQYDAAGSRHESPLAFSSGLILLVAGLFVWLAAPARAEWTVVNLHPAGASYSSAVAVHSGQQVGHVIIGGVRRASLWNGTAVSWVDLHPPGANWSEALDVHAGQQVGHARIGDIFQPFRASLWSGTAASRVDLHPAAASGGTVAQSSYAYGISAGTQVGNAFVDDESRASVWSGTAASWMDLHPAGALASVLLGTSGEQQVGYVFIGMSRASLWNGTAESWVDLHPAGDFTASFAYGVHANEQVGYVGMPGGLSRAALWRGTAESFVDLSPAGSTHSAASGVHAGNQVGSAMLAGVHRASLWRGTAESWEDLSLALPGSWGETTAFGIWSDTTTTYVVGHGYNLDTGRYEALLWTRPLDLPIPLTIQLDGNQVVLSWSDPAFALQAAPDAAGAYTNIPSATSPHTNAIIGTKVFFRLVRSE